MKLVTSESMRAIDNQCIEVLGIPGLKLMENAGVGTVRFMEHELGALAEKKFTVVCGKGNNGGDGFVIARELSARGASVGIYLAGHAADVSGDARTNLERLGADKVVELSDGKSMGQFLEAMTKSDVVVDAVFGTGFKGVPRGLSGTVIGQMNVCGRPVLAVDVPSGLNATAGVAEGECVRATWTCTMGLPKRGFYLYPGRNYLGRLHVVDIGVPAKAIEEVGVHDNVLTAGEAAALLPRRPGDAHKGTFGKVVIVAGSVGYTGAAALASMSAARSGAGLVFLGTPAGLNDVMETKLTEVITKPLPETAGRAVSREALEPILDLIRDADALAIGPGLSQDPSAQALVQAVVEEVTIPCVVDADGVNALSPQRIAGRRGRGPMVLTPHPGEMSRLTGHPVAEILRRRDEIAREVAGQTDTTVVLKGAGSLIVDPGGELFLNPTGNSGLASGGSGDVLTGVIATLLGQGLSTADAGALGAYVHGLAGDIVAAEKGEIGMIASDVMEALPEAFLQVAGAA